MNKLSDGKFNFDPNILKFQGLLEHDLRKPYPPLRSIYDLLSEMKDNFTSEEPSGNTLDTFDTFKNGALGYLKCMRGAFAILKSISESQLLKHDVKLSLADMLNLLIMTPTDDPCISLLKQTGKRLPTRVAFDLNFNLSDKVLSIEELFSIHTLLINLVGSKVTRAEVKIMRAPTYDTISISDDLVTEGLGLKWPSAMLSDYQMEYDRGYLNPSTPINSNERGLRMVHNLSGQRDAANSRFFKDLDLIGFEDGDLETGKLKSIKMLFPKEQALEA